MYNRAVIVDQNFILRVSSGDLPRSLTSLTYQSLGLTASDVVDMFESQLISRHLDLQARLLKERSESFYTIGSSGHEGNVALGKVFSLNDMAFLHYRSGGFMVQRSKKRDGSSPIYDFMLSFVAAADDPISAGRHKVFGSKGLLVPPQTSTIASHLPKAVGAAFSINRAKELKLKSQMKLDEVVFCNFGDASANHSTSQGAFNSAQWVSYRGIPLPIVFCCEDNGIGISVNTPPNWIASSFRNRPAIKYISCDGLNLLDAYRGAAEAYRYAKKTRKPVFLHMRTVRLMGHAGSDMETEYKTLQAIAENEAYDPLLYSAAILLDQQICTKDEILAMYESIRERIQAVAEIVVKKPKLSTPTDVMASIVPPKRDVTRFAAQAKSRELLFGKQFKNLDKPKNMAQMLNLALADLMNEQNNIVLFGEDVGKKGGVYHVTAGLQEMFSGKRVFDTLLDEQTILGNAIGMAQNGFLPIPEIQFLAYFHNAEDQIRGEAATLSFFSNGQFTNPMVVRIAGLAYQKGFGGHFHNDNSVAALRDIPGVIVVCPSNGANAVSLLKKSVQLAQEEQRVVIFLEPIALYMERDLHEKGDGLWLNTYDHNASEATFLDVASHGKGRDVAIVTYGNGCYLSQQAQEVLKKKHKINSKVIDLQWLSPLPIDSLLKEIDGYSHIYIVDECRKTGSPSEELITQLVERCEKLPKIKRLTGHDTYIPLGRSWQFILPSRDTIVDGVVEFLK
jgi:2-oxoisovalerate dehydrogenase E1 component